VHQATIVLNICCEDRREAPFQLGCFHIQISIAQARVRSAQTTAELVVACLLWAGKHGGRFTERLPPEGRGIDCPGEAKDYFLVRCSPLFPWASVE
jgi:hypothetical protein